MYVGLKQPRGDGERYVTPARAASKETSRGVVCNRIETRGTWSLQESSLHINCLELLAATNAHVLIRMDNTSTIAYLNKMGGAKQGVLDKHARTLWEWCLSRKITLRAEYIPGRLNVI